MLRNSASVILSGLNSLPASSLTPERWNLKLFYIRWHAFPLLKECRSLVTIYHFVVEEIWVLVCESHFPILLNRKCQQLFSCSTFSQQPGKKKKQNKLMVYFNLPLKCRYSLFSPSQSPRCVTLSGSWEETLFFPSLTVFWKTSVPNCCTFSCETLSEQMIIIETFSRLEQTLKDEMI